MAPAIFSSFDFAVIGFRIRWYTIRKSSVASKRRGQVREYRCPARHRIVPYTSIRKSLSSAGKRSGLGHVRPHDLRHTFVTRMLDLGVPIEQVNYLAGHKSMSMTKRYDHANEERYGAAIEALDEAGKTGSAEALAEARWKQT